MDTQTNDYTNQLLATISSDMDKILADVKEIKTALNLK